MFLIILFIKDLRSVFSIFFKWGRAVSKIGFSSGFALFSSLFSQRPSTAREAVDDMAEEVYALLTTSSFRNGVDRARDANTNLHF